MDKQQSNFKNETKTISNQSMPRGYKTIRLPCDMDSYKRMLNDASFFKTELKRFYSAHPQLFPKAFSRGYCMHGFTDSSKKLQFRQRRILLNANKEVYTIAPCDVMPYMTGFVEDVEKPLFLLRFGVPYWAISYSFGRDPMYWYRMESAFGRNSIVGTTVKDPNKLPQHLSADEKHSWLKGEKVYIATTVGAQSILGVSVCENADEISLKEGYSQFQKEAKNISEDYEPTTVNTDGWKATELAWTSLFSKIIIICCFLHSFIKIRDRCKKFGDLFFKTCEKVWYAYKAKTKRSFCQRIRRLKEWGDENTTGLLKDKLLGLCGKVDSFSKAYDHPECHRTSNMIDRLMRWMDQSFFNAQYFHGNLDSANIKVRSFAILRNFQPYARSIANNGKETFSAAKSLNGFAYRDNWLKNLITSTSMAGYRQ